MTAQKRERNYGIDLLRILAMYLVVVLHVLGGGRVLNGTDPNPATHEAAWLLESFAMVAVNCFALISGYVGLRAKHGITGLALLYLQVWTYSAGIMLALRFLRPEWVDTEAVLHALLPVGYGEYWYFTAYIGLFFFMPLLNAAAEHLSRTQFFVSASGMILLYAVYRSAIMKDIFIAKNGYSTIWLIILYYIGAGMAKHIRLTKKAVPVGLAVYAAASVLGWMAATDPDRFARLRYDSTPTVIASLALFCACAALPLRAKPLQNLIAFLSPLTFAVYLIHTHPLVYNYILTKRFEHWSLYSPKHMIFNVILTAAGIFLVCCAAEFVRAWIVKLLHVKQGLKKLEGLLQAQAAALAEKHAGKNAETEVIAEK